MHHHSPFFGSNNLSPAFVTGSYLLSSPFTTHTLMTYSRGRALKHQLSFFYPLIYTLHLVFSPLPLISSPPYNHCSYHNYTLHSLYTSSFSSHPNTILSSPITLQLSFASFHFYLVSFITFFQSFPIYLSLLSLVSLSSHYFSFPSSSFLSFLYYILSFTLLSSLHSLLSHLFCIFFCLLLSLSSNVSVDRDGKLMVIPLCPLRIWVQFPLWPRGLAVWVLTTTQSLILRTPQSEILLPLHPSSILLSLLALISSHSSSHLKTLVPLITLLILILLLHSVRGGKRKKKEINFECSL